MPDYPDYTEMNWYKLESNFYPDLTPVAGKHGFGVLNRYYALPDHFPIGPDAYGMTEVSITDPDVRADIISGFYRIYGGDFSYVRPHIAAFFRWILRPELPVAKQNLADLTVDHYGRMLAELYGKTSPEERDHWHILEDLAADLDSGVPEVAETARAHLAEMATEAEHDKFRTANLEQTGDAIDPAVYMAAEIRARAESLRTSTVAAMKFRRRVLEEIATAADHDELEDIEDGLETRFTEQTMAIQTEIAAQIAAEEEAAKIADEATDDETDDDGEESGSDPPDGEA